MKITLDADGTLCVRIVGPQAVDLVDGKQVPRVDSAGQAITLDEWRRIPADQIAAHRRDPALEAALSTELRAELDALEAARLAALAREP